VIVIAAALVLMIWAAAQQFVNSAAKRRVAIAEAGRRCLIQATTAVEEGIELLTASLNEGPEADTLRSQSIALQFRELQPGTVLEFSYTPSVAELPGGGVDVHLSEVHGTAFLTDVSGERGSPPLSFNCQKYKDFLLKWNKVPG
jgi:hypothetical protein